MDFIPSFKGGILQCFAGRIPMVSGGRYQHPTGQEEQEKDEREVMMAMASDGCLDLRDSHSIFSSYNVHHLKLSFKEEL